MESPEKTAPLFSEVVRIALSPEAKYLVKSGNRQQHVDWAVLVGLPMRRESLVEAGDLVFCLARGDDPEWEKSITQLVEMGVSGLVVAGDDVPEAALAKATDADIPVVSLLAGSNLRDAHRTVLTLLTNPQAQLGQRSGEIYGELARMVAEGAELQKLAEVVAEITGKGVLVQDKRLNPVASVPLADMSPDAWRSLVSRLEVASALPEGWSDRRAAASESVTVQRQHASDGLVRLVAPITVKEMARGYISLIGQDGEFDTLDLLAIEQAAVACAMEMARAKAVSEATKRWRGEFIDAVLAKSVPPQEIRLWAKRIGYDAEAPHAVVVWCWAAAQNHPSLRRLETIVNGEVNLGRYSALVRAGENHVSAFVALDMPDTIKQARQLADTVHHLAHKEYSKSVVYCGLGRPVQGVSDWLVSHREAQQALLIARRLESNKPLEFGDLSVHRLLFQLDNNPELHDFCDEMLGALLRYDHVHNSTLVETLNAYFENHGNLSETAKALYIHRNTLQYRMERVGQIAGFDLSNPEQRLAMQLALKAYKLLPSDTWDAA